MTDTCNALSIVTAVIGVLLIASELLPYASSSTCNSIIEGISHVFCRNNCFKSNKGIIHQNIDFQKEIAYLRDEIKNLTMLRASIDMVRGVESV
jgi:hypothetical protein